MRIPAQLFILLSFCVLNGLANSCTEIFRKLYDAQSKFVDCAVHNSVPANVCVSCNDQHKLMISKYDDLVKNCSQQYISQNRLDLVFNMENYLNTIWNKGFCDDCFNGSNTISDETDKFNKYKIDFDTCLNQHPKTECTHCTRNYIELNDFFKQLEKLKKGKVCFDLQDAMNRTRLKWSKELKCCHREFNVTLFLVGSAIFSAIPLMFYLGMYGYTRRQERNHELIDSTYGTASQQNLPSTSNTTVGPTSTREAPPIEDDLKFDKPDKSVNIKKSNSADTPASTSRQSNAALIEL